MADTQTLERSIAPDAAPTRLKLTEAGVNRLMTVLRVTEVDDLATRLGFSRQTFWRLRTGDHDIRLSKATLLCRIARWPMRRMFEQVDADA